MKPVILDTGPLVAWFCPRDQHHGWSRRIFAQLLPGATVCEAVLAETCHLAAKDGVPRGKIIEFVERGRLVLFSLSPELALIRQLLNRYADADMDFADACIVRLAELDPSASICTTDRDFLFFRKNGSEPLSLIAPFSTESN